MADVLADPQSLGELFVVGMQGAAQAIGEWRYKDGDKIKASKEGEKAMLKAAVVFVQASAIKMTPGQALIAAVAAAYAPAIATAEMEMYKARKERKLRVA